MTYERYIGSYVAGEYTHTLDSSSTFTGTFQPAPGEDTQVDTGGRRKSNSDMIFTSTQLFPTVNKDGRPSDIVLYNGITYEVKKVAYWGNSVLPHYAVEVEEQKEGVSR
jgi:hypothetical protein